MSRSGRIYPLGYSRRQAIGLLATGVGLSLGAGCGRDPSLDVATRGRRRPGRTDRRLP